MASTAALEATHDRLTRAVEALTTGEDWRAMLEVVRRFHTYSANNVLLITAQRPDATRVASYGTWKRLGRYVRKGERGIAILAPVVARLAADKELQAAGEVEEERVVLRGFRVVYVFDVAQTDGAPLPEVAPAALSGSAPAAVFDALASVLEASGYHLLRADCRPANGRTHFLTRTVVVRPDLSPAQALKTLVHEIAHTRLHDGSEYGAGCRDVVEVEAESVAYLVCTAVGLPTDAYSFPYVARWADGDVELVRRTATRVVSCARQVLEAIGVDTGAGALVAAEQH